MNESKTIKKNPHAGLLGITVLIVAVVFLGWYVWGREEGFTNSTSSSGGKATTTLDIGGVTIEIPHGSDAKVEVVNENNTNAGPAPSLDRKTVFPKGYPVEGQPLFLKKLSDLKALLAKDPYSYDSWVSLGLLWKMVEDYEGTRLAWEYAARLSPQSSVVFGNLGFLYGYYLHDNSKAEEYFKTALKNSPEQLYLYQQFFEFYRDVLKNPEKARALAEEGKRVTGSTDFFSKLLGTL